VATRLIILCLMCFLLQNWAHIEDFAQLCYNPTPSLVSDRTVFWWLLLLFACAWHQRVLTSSFGAAAARSIGCQCLPPYVHAMPAEHRV